MGLDKEDIKQLIAILQKGLTDDADQNPQKTTKKNKRKTINPSDTNNFIKLGFHQLHKEDTVTDRLLNKNKKRPIPRRKETTTISVRCRVCGKQDTINPNLLYESADRYKCNKCCSSPG